MVENTARNLYRLRTSYRGDVEQMAISVCLVHYQFWRPIKGIATGA